MSKTTQLWTSAITKPLDLQCIMRYLWKDNIQIFHLVPKEVMYVQRFGCKQVLKIMATSRSPSFLSDMSISSSLSLTQVITHSTAPSVTRILRIWVNWTNMKWINRVINLSTAPIATRNSGTDVSWKSMKQNINVLSHTAAPTVPKHSQIYYIVLLY